MTRRFFRQRPAWPLVLILLGTACGPGQGAPDAAVVRDSAGVRIVESAAPASTGTDALALGADAHALGQAAVGAQDELQHRVVQDREGHQGGHDQGGAALGQVR